MARSSPSTSRSKTRFLGLYILIAACIMGYILFKGFQALQASLFFTAPQRINIVMYGPETSFYSLDMEQGRHYQIIFPADLKVDVPGGYGQYRVGSLGKLASLDENAHLIQKAFASTTTTFIHFYFYPQNEDVFYGDSVSEETYKPSLQDIVFQSGNASILNRIFLFSHLLGEKSTSFTQIRYSKEENDVLGETVFNEDTFKKNSLGLLYQNAYRDEQESIQILYPRRYVTADRIATILEGNGIRVNDISLDLDRSDRCKVVYSSESPSKTAKDIASYFACPLTSGKTDVYDIQFILGQRVGEWEI